MPQIPNDLGEGGSGLTPSDSDGLKALLNGIADDLASIQGDAPAAITSPAGTAVPTITSPLGTAVPALTAAAPADISTAALADLTSLRSYVVALVTENAQNRSYITALRTEVVALRAAQTTRSELTLNTEASPDHA